MNAICQMQSTFQNSFLLNNAKNCQNLKPKNFASSLSAPANCLSQTVAAGSNSNQTSVFQQQKPIHANSNLPTPLDQQQKNPTTTKKWFTFPFNKKNNNIDQQHPPSLFPNQDPLLPPSTTSLMRSPPNSFRTAPTPNVSATTPNTAPGTALHSLPTAASIVHRILQRPLNRKQQQQLPSNSSYVQKLEASAMIIISQLWADSTVEKRCNVWNRFLLFTSEHKFRIERQQEMDWAIVMFLEHVKQENPDLKASTVLSYAKDLAAIASRLTLQVPITRMYQSGLRATGALIPQEQAPPLPFRPHLLRLAKESLKYTSRANHSLLGKRLYTLLFLMVKTCSRFDEVQRLQRSQIKVLNDQELFIDWADRTKSTRSDPNREDTKVIVHHGPGIPPEVLEVLDKWEWHTLLSYNVEWFNKWLNTALGDLQGMNALRQPLTETKTTKTTYSAHSIKAAVVTHLTRMWHQGLISGTHVSMIAKHAVEESSRMDGVSRQTLRYVRDPVLVARMSKSDQSTSLIPWVLPEQPPLPPPTPLPSQQ